MEIAREPKLGDREIPRRCRWQQKQSFEVYSDFGDCRPLDPQLVDEFNQVGDSAKSGACADEKNPPQKSRQPEHVRAFTVSSSSHSTFCYFSFVHNECKMSSYSLACDEISSSSESESESENKEVEDDELETITTKRTHGNRQYKHQSSSNRIVLCMDVDCFYCQCEELELFGSSSTTTTSELSQSQQERDDRRLSPPMAIGQKHIIVTCNYIARNMGVSKLMSKTEALSKCPSLRIVDGSDLEKYRRHSVQIYKTLRTEVYAMCAEYNNTIATSTSATNSHEEDLRTKVAMQKGGMDEVFCDLTALVDAIIDTTRTNNQHKDNNDELLRTLLLLPSNAFLYGDDVNDDDRCYFMTTRTHGNDSNNSRTSNSNSSIVLTEDQTGAQSVIRCCNHRNRQSLESTSLRHHHQEKKQRRQQIVLRQRLHVAASCADRLQQAIYRHTNFTTSVGVSTSPMLSKIASGLRKPNGLSVLYPFGDAGGGASATTNMIAQMPLRKVPQLGRSTIKALEPCLKEYNHHHDDSNKNTVDGSFWKCRDLLQVPRHMIVTCLQTMNKNKLASEVLCDDLLDKCRGIDNSIIQDDRGGLAKTVSVENSFRRNTIRTTDAVRNEMQDLYRRLPRLLDDRRDYSTCPALAYPTTIRLTVAMVDRKLVHSNRSRRPFVTKSKQRSFPAGKLLLMEPSVKKKSDLIQDAVAPLVEDLVVNQKHDVNVVRINIAVTGFQDLERHDESSSAVSKFTANASSPWAAFTRSKSPKEGAKKRPRCASTSSSQTVLPKPKGRPPSSPIEPTFFSSESSINSTNVKVDLDVLAELPADIRAEVCRAYNMADTTSKCTIDQFFEKK